MVDLSLYVLRTRYFSSHQSLGARFAQYISTSPNKLKRVCRREDIVDLQTSVGIVATVTLTLRQTPYPPNSSAHGKSEHTLTVT